jgi:triacylglycerol lipase
MRSKTVNLLSVFFAGVLLSACGMMHSSENSSIKPGQEPIIFVHGNGDNSLLWTTTAWRFESNGWPRDRLFAFDMPLPVSRDLNDIAQQGRSSAEEYTTFLVAKIEEVKRATGASKVILIGNSRGGYPIRRFVRDGGAASVSAVILGGTPNHGVSVSTTVAVTNEYNGAGPWLSALNSVQGPAGAEEVTAGVRFLTLRSDHNDLYAQPTGFYLGTQMDTHVTFEGPALAGATNVVLPGVDHRETAYSSVAFAQMWKFLTGVPPSFSVIDEPHPEVSGHIFSVEQQVPTNLPLPGTHVQIFVVDPATGQRVGAALLDTRVGQDGHWGPVALDSKKRYEFALDHPDYSITHIYLGDLRRSTSWLNFSLQPKPATASADSVVQFARPSGYFNATRDVILLDGVTPKAIQTPLPSKSSATVTIPAAEAMRPVIARYDDEVIAAPAWPGRNADGTSQRVVEEMLD